MDPALQDMGASSGNRESRNVAETPFDKSAPTIVNENATLDDLKAKRERQRASATTSPSSAAPSKVTAPRDPPAPPAATGQGKAARPDRVGKVLIAGYFPLETSKALKHIAVDEGLTLQQVMADAFTLYLKSKRTR